MPVTTLDPVTEVTTSSGVEFTARAAYDAGFRVSVAAGLSTWHPVVPA